MDAFPDFLTMCLNFLNTQNQAARVEVPSAPPPKFKFTIDEILQLPSRPSPQITPDPYSATPSPLSLLATGQSIPSVVPCQFFQPPPAAITRTCSNCKTTESSYWRCIRTDPMCNACYVYHNKYKKHRPPPVNLRGSRTLKKPKLVVQESQLS